jgi:hypothetical protein
MANHFLIANTAGTLASIIRRRLAELGLGAVEVGVVSAGLLKEGLKENFVSIFPYLVSKCAEAWNAPETVLKDGSRRRPPLTLEICFLITPWAVRSSADRESEATATKGEMDVLGAVMQALHDEPEVSGADLATKSDVAAEGQWGAVDSLQILLEPLTVETMYRIWDAAEIGYKLSVAYRVRVGSLESGRSTKAPPVVVASLEAA